MTAEDTNRSFKCKVCGACCRWPGHVLLEDADLARLAAAAGLSEERFISEYTALASNRRQLTLAERPDGSCILLEGATCLHYAARPRQCREYPHGWRDTSGCPGFGIGV